MSLKPGDEVLVSGSVSKYKIGYVSPIDGSFTASAVKELKPLSHYNNIDSEMKPGDIYGYGGSLSEVLTPGGIVRLLGPGGYEYALVTRHQAGWAQERTLLVRDGKIVQ